MQVVFRFKSDFWSHRVLRRLEEPPLPDDEFERLESAARRLLLADQSSAGLEDEFSLARTALFLVEVTRQMKSGEITAAERQRAETVTRDLAGDSLGDRVEAALKQLADWGVQVFVAPSRRSRVQGWLSYVRPHKMDFQQLVPLERPRADLPELARGPEARLRHRDGFHLTDPRMTRAEYLREVDYCIFCHPREKDSCAHGFAEKGGGFKKNPLGISLEGCPLDERISEMHTLCNEGYVIGALAMIMLDNPMCP
jgi:hypothetical protein